jgi:hypothetical protein
MSDLMDAVTAIRDARAAYEEAEAYYYGRVGEVFASPAIKRRLEKTSGKHKINLAKRPVDAILDRLELAAVSVAGDDEATEWLAGQWARNEMPLEALEVHWAAGVYGDAYLLVWPSEDDGEGDGRDVEMYYNSPLTTRVFYDPERPRQRRYAAKMWPESDRLRVTLYYPDRIERWVSREKTRGVAEADFEHYSEDGDEGSWPQPHDYGEVPVFHFRTRRPYGHPDHEDAYGPQDYLTKLAATQLSTTDFHGFPQRWAISGATDDGVAGFDDDDEAAAPKGEVSDLKAGAGELWLLRNVDKVGQFDQADVSAFLDPMAAYVEMMAATTATPAHYFKPGSGVPSGESFRAAEGPLVVRVRRRQLSCGATWRQVAELALRLGGRQGTVSVAWAPAQTIDDLDGWQAVKAKIDAGVPTGQALLEAGYTAGQVDAWLSGTSEEDFRSRVEVLALLGDAVQKLGAGAALGVVSSEQVGALLSKLLDEQGEEPEA